MTNKAIENGPFIVELHMNNDDFLQLRYQREWGNDPVNNELTHNPIAHGIPSIVFQGAETKMCSQACHLCTRRLSKNGGIYFKGEGFPVMFVGL
jgi:hypothetical protein